MQHCALWWCCLSVQNRKGGCHEGRLAAKNSIGVVAVIGIGISVSDTLTDLSSNKTVMMMTARGSCAFNRGSSRPTTHRIHR